MRIGIISRELPPYGGGIGSWSQKAAAGLARRDHDVELFTEIRADAGGNGTIDGVTVRRVEPLKVRPRSLGWAVAVARAVRSSGRFDVVQACEWDAEAVVFALRPSAPLVTRLATPHFLVQSANGSPRRQRLRSSVTSSLEHAQVRLSRRVISPTAVLAEKVAKAWGVRAASIAVVPTGIEPPRLGAATADPVLGETPYILYFGRLEVRKGVDVLIDALPEVLSRHPHVHCVFIGEDVGFRGRPFADYAYERCGDLWPRLHFMPRMPHAELFRIVAGATLVVIPSRWENLANTCLESMVLARPIIATTGSGFDEVLTDGVDAVLVPPGDAAALASSADRLLDHPRELERLGVAARRTAERFTVDGMARGLEEVYAGLVR